MSPHVVCFCRVHWCYTEKATPARHRPERQDNACANRRKQCSPNETKSNHTPTRHARAKGKRTLQTVTPRRMKPTHTRLTYTRMRPHALSQQAGDHPVPAHTPGFCRVHLCHVARMYGKLTQALPTYLACVAETVHPTKTTYAALPPRTELHAEMVTQVRLLPHTPFAMWGDGTTTDIPPPPPPGPPPPYPLPPFLAQQLIPPLSRPATLSPVRSSPFPPPLPQRPPPYKVGHAAIVDQQFS